MRKMMICKVRHYPSEYDSSLWEGFENFLREKLGLSQGDAEEVRSKFDDLYYESFADLYEQMYSIIQERLECELGYENPTKIRISVEPWRTDDYAKKHAGEIAEGTDLSDFVDSVLYHFLSRGSTPEASGDPGWNDLKNRDISVANHWHQVLRENEIGILFVGCAHRVEEFLLPRGISCEVIYPEEMIQKIEMLEKEKAAELLIASVKEIAGEEKAKKFGTVVEKVGRHTLDEILEYLDSAGFMTTTN